MNPSAFSPSNSPKSRARTSFSKASLRAATPSARLFIRASRSFASYACAYAAARSAGTPTVPASAAQTPSTYTSFRSPGRVCSVYVEPQLCAAFSAPSTVVFTAAIRFV